MFRKLTNQSNFGLDLSSSATAAILRGAPLGGEGERTFFAFFTLVFRKHTKVLWSRAGSRIAKPL